MIQIVLMLLKTYGAGAACVPSYHLSSMSITPSCKHDGCYKARLVAGGPLSPDPIDSIYSGVVSTRFLRLSMFLA